MTSLMELHDGLSNGEISAIPGTKSARVGEQPLYAGNLGGVRINDDELLQHVTDSKEASILGAPTTGDGPDGGGAVLETAPELIDPEEGSPALGPSIQLGGTVQPGPKSQKRADTLTQARRKVDTNPTEGQQEAGNYRKGHTNIHGLPITLENPVGSTRSGRDSDGKSWAIKMKHDYGYIKRTEGKDGDHVDVFIGPEPETELIYVVNQRVGGKFDEHKCLLGFPTEAKAKEGYLANYQKGWNGLGSIYPITVPQFKWWLQHGDTTKEIKHGQFAKHRKRNNGNQKTANDNSEGVEIATSKDLDDFFSSRPNKEGRRCPGCNKLFKDVEPYAGVENCETCERFGTKRAEERQPSVAVDLDGTVAEELEEFDPDVVGPPRPGAKKWLDAFRDAGAMIIIYTCRGDEDVVKSYLDEHDLPFDHINKNPNQPPGSSDKLYADVYWDNRAIDASGALYKSAPEVLERIQSKAAALCGTLQSLHVALDSIPASVKSAEPFWRQGIKNQLQQPVYNPSKGLLPNLVTNARGAKDHAQRRIQEQDSLNDLRSALEPGFALQRFQRFMHEGDFVKDPVDRAMFRGTSY